MHSKTPTWTCLWFLLWCFCSNSVNLCSFTVCPFPYWAVLSFSFHARQNHFRILDSIRVSFFFLWVNMEKTMEVSVLIFYCCVTKYHKLRGNLKEHPVISSQCCRSWVQVRYGAVLRPGSCQAEVQGLVRLYSFLEVLGKNLPLNSSKLMEFRPLQS